MNGLSYFKKRNSIFIRTFASYLILITVPFLLFGIAAYYWAYNSLREQTQFTYSSALHDIQKEVDLHFERMDSFALQFSYTPWVSKLMNMEGSTLGYDRVDIAEMLNILQELKLYKTTYEFVQDIAVYLNEKDTVLSTKGKDNLERFFSDLVHFDHVGWEEWKQTLSVRNDRRLMIHQEIDADNKQHAKLTYIQSLPPGDSNFLATLVLFIDEQALLDVFAKSTLLKNSLLLITDSSDQLIAQTNEAAFESTKTSDYSTISKSLKWESAQGESYALYHVQSPKTNWMYTVAIPAQTFSNELLYIQVVAAALTLFYMVLGLFLSYLLTMRNYRPIARIMSTVRSKLFNEDTDKNEFNVLEHAILDMITNANRNTSEIELYRPLARNTCLNHLLKPDAAQKPVLRETMAFLGLEFERNYVMCMVILIDEDRVLDESQHRQLQAIFMPLDAAAYWVELEPRRKAVVLNMNETGERAEAVSRVAEFLTQCSWTYKSVGIGRMYEHCDQLSHSYEDASAAVDYRFVRGEGTMIYVDEIEDRGDWRGYFPEEESLIIAIKSGAIHEAIRIARETVNHHIAAYCLTAGMARFLCYSVAAASYKALEQMEAGIPTRFNLKVLWTMDDLTDMFGFIEELYREAAATIAGLKESGNNTLILQVLDYINDNYQDPSLSLSQVSDQFHITASYLSRFFKDQTGTNFIDYVHKKRIDASQRLLLCDTTILQVAQKIGFENDVTFRRLFKKYMGITPSKFKERA